jgi:hypothetical protein
MKNLALVFLTIVISFSSLSQFYTETVFLNIWNNYRSSINITPAYCDFQHYYGIDVTPTYNVLIYIVEKSGDTTYRSIECTGDKKIISAYHDKNTNKLFQAACSIPLDSIYDDSKLPLNYLTDSNFTHPLAARRYLDSLAFNKVFKTIISSSEYESILSSNFKFHLKINKIVSKDQLNMVYTIQFFEIFDATDTSISSDYDATYVKGNFEKLKPYIVDKATLKLKYPN